MFKLHFAETQVSQSPVPAGLIKVPLILNTAVLDSLKLGRLVL